MKTRVLLAFLLLLTVLLACNQSSGPSGPAEVETDPPPVESNVQEIAPELPISNRSFEMGTAGFVPRHYPDSTNEDWQDFFEYGAASYGGIYGVHLNPGEKANQDGILEQVQLAYEQVVGVEAYVAFSVNHEDGPFTAEQGEQLVRVAVATAQEYQPEYISLGVECNSFYIYQPDTFGLYVQYAREAYDAIKSVSPDTKVMNNFQLERMKGEASLTGQDFGPNWHILSMFEGKIDLISFTVYPFLEFKSVDEIPDDYLAEIREHSGLPIMITETGWPSEDLQTGVSGSDEDQIEYILKLVQQANDLEVEVIIWVFPHDASFGLAGGIFDHISLHDNEGNPKPGYVYWKAIQALPSR